MNHHSAPGGWEPPEPSWMKELRDIERSIKQQVDRHIRGRPRDFALWFSGGMLGYWVGFGSAQLLLWWVGHR